MPLLYVQSRNDHYQQGEVLKEVLEYRPVLLSGVADVGDGLEVKEHVHPLVIVVSQACDLVWDYQARSGEETVRDDKLLQHVLFCDLYPKEEIKARNALNSTLLSAVSKNQHERYHHLDEAAVEGASVTLPELYADFKQVFSLPAEFAYALLSAGHVHRLGVLPSPHREDFTHRLYSFLGRVAV